MHLLNSLAQTLNSGTMTLSQGVTLFRLFGTRNFLLCTSSRGRYASGTGPCFLCCFASPQSPSETPGSNFLDYYVALMETCKTFRDDISS